MSRKQFLVVVLLLLVNACFGQRAQKNAVYVELGGNGTLYSVNYEREFKTQWVGRIGISYYDNYLNIPVMFGRYFGEGKHHFEVTAGITCIVDNTNDGVYYYHGSFQESGSRTHILLTAFAGYRFQKQDKNFLFKAGFTPFYSPHDSRDKINTGWFLPWVGVSFGYRF